MTLSLSFCVCVMVQAPSAVELVFMVIFFFELLLKLRVLETVSFISNKKIIIQGSAVAVRIALIVAASSACLLCN